MAREKESYRDNLERLDTRFPEGELLNVKNVKEFCGISEERAKEMFTFKKIGGRYYISKAVLARELS